MEKIDAAKIVDLLIDFGDKLDQSVVLVRDKCPEEEYNEYRHAIGKIMGTMLLDIMNPIFDQYPELKPNRLK